MSSQFLSSLLMASPTATGDITISIKDELISAPYVSLTIGLMKKFGVEVEIEGDMEGTPSFKIPGAAKYQSPESMLVEGDASSASYFIAGAAITGGTVILALMIITVLSKLFPIIPMWEIKHENEELKQ